jgi:hypothetical protein
METGQQDDTYSSHDNFLTNLTFILPKLTGQSTATGYATVPQTFLFADPFRLAKNSDRHSHPYINIIYTQCPDDRYPKLKTNISEMITDSYEQIPIAYIQFIPSFNLN